MKKVIALIGKGFSAQSIAQTVVTAFGTAKNIVVRIGAADPTGQQKVAFGPIIGEANEEFLQDLLDVTDGVVIAHFETLVGSPSVRGSIELELETACMPDLQPYVAPEAKEEEAPKQEPIKTAPRQVTEPETQNQKVVVAQGFLEFCKSLETLGVDRESAHAYGMRMIEVVGGKVETRVTFQDGSVLRRNGDQWEVA